MQEGRQEEARQRTLERELEWVRQSPRARQAKSKARVAAYDALVAQSREKAPETITPQIAQANFILNPPRAPPHSGGA